MDWIISPLNAIGRSVSSLKKDPFNSGFPDLDRYLKQYAKKNDEKGIARTYVAFASQDSQIIAGYYSCCASVVDHEELPAELRESLPRYPSPAILIGKLAVDQSRQGKGLGKRLLFHALENAVDVSQKVGVYAITVDAIDEEAKSFYKKYGFLEYQDTPLSLFISMTTIKRAIDIRRLQSDE